MEVRVSTTSLLLLGQAMHSVLTLHRLYQLQAVSAEFLEKFEFSLPEDKPRILRGPGAGMVALVEEKSGEQIAAMPLRVSLAQ